MRMQCAREIHNVVAELMLFANESVASYLHARIGSAALLRRHRAPGKEKVKDMADQLCALQLGTMFELDDLSDSARLSSLLSRLQHALSASAFHTLQIAITRGMEEAEYVSVGKAKRDDPGHQLASLRHFGLAATYYTHFTSPIRRYADVVVHRQLLHAVVEDPHSGVVPAWWRGGGEVGEEEHARKRGLYFKYRQTTPPLPSSVPAVVEDWAAHINDKHRRAKQVQLDCTHLFLCFFASAAPLSRRVFPATVTAVNEEGVEVSVPSLQVRDVVSEEEEGEVRTRMCEVEGGGEKWVGEVRTSASPPFEVEVLDTVQVEVRSNLAGYGRPRLRLHLHSKGEEGVKEEERSKRGVVEQAVSMSALLAPSASTSTLPSAVGEMRVTVDGGGKKKGKKEVDTLFATLSQLEDERTAELKAAMHAVEEGEEVGF